MLLNVKINSSFGSVLIIKLDKDNQFSSMNKECSQFIKDNELNHNELINQFRPYVDKSDRSYSITINKTAFILNIVRYIEGVTFALNPIQQLNTANKESAVVSVEDLHKMRLMTLGEMTAGIIHDINNPIGICLSGVELAEFFTEDLIDVLTTSEQKEKVEIIKEKLKEIKSGVSRITEISEGIRMLMHKNQVAFKVQDLVKVVENSSSFCTSFLRKNKIDLKIIDPLNEVSVKCKESLISQVVVNLIKNASDAIKDLPIHKKWIQISFEDRKDWSVLRLEDGGDGIPDNLKAKIFEPFFTTKDLGVGTGLGLSLCNQILEVHGGKIEIDSSAKNTAFLLLFPKKN